MCFLCLHDERILGCLVSWQEVRHTHSLFITVWILCPSASTHFDCISFSIWECWIGNVCFLFNMPYPFSCITSLLLLWPCLNPSKFCDSMKMVHPAPSLRIVWSSLFASLSLVPQRRLPSLVPLWFSYKLPANENSQEWEHFNTRFSSCKFHYYECAHP